MKQEDKEEAVEGIVKSEKKHKKRQKKILADLKKQIEFYFSEPNLQKDRFLRQKIAENAEGCVEIATIASFNRIMQLCKDITLVIKAMKMCPSVEVIDNKWVKPSKPLTEPKNVDPMTIYVEQLPPEADHHWIKSLFSSCGNVVYVSLPRYKSTRNIKGFAFVEFETENEAGKALEMFKKEGTREEREDDEKEKEDKSVEMTEKQMKKSKKRKQKLSESENEDGKKKGKRVKHKKGDEMSELSVLSENENTSKQKKRKRSLDKEETDESETGVKSKKDEGINNEVSESEGSVSAGGKRKRDENNHGEDDSEETVSRKKMKTSREEESETADVEEGTGKKHKKRKRRKKEKEETVIPELRVISKLEWLRLKKEYQKLQREAMKQTKMNLKHPDETAFEQPENNETARKPSDNVEKRTPNLSNNTKAEYTEKPKSKMDLPAKLEMVPGVVLKYDTKESMEKQKLREMFSSIAQVSYLEKEDDQEKGYVRFVTKEGCKKVVEAVENGSLAAVMVQELTEGEDIEYWEKLNNDRMERFQQKKRKKRGTQKIVDKIEAQARKRDHIHFGE